MYPTSSLQDTFQVVAKFLPNLPVAATTRLPLEILELVIDKADSSCLLKLSLTSRDALRRSRARLFSNLSFIEDDGTHWIDELLPKEGEVNRQLDRFLDLLESPDNTIATSIRTLHLHYLFNSRRYEYKPRDKMHLTTTRLSRLACLRLSSMSWDNIPCHILEWIQALPATELQIESISFFTPRFIELFESPLMAHASPKLSLCGIRIKDTKNVKTLASHSRAFAQKFHFSALDITSLVLFRDVWDLAMTTGTQITVHKLYLHLKTTGSPYTDYVPALPFLNTILCQIGPCLESLCMALGDYEAERGFYQKLDISQCTALKAIHIGVIILGQQQEDLEKVWDNLDRLPSSPIESVGFILHPSMMSTAELPNYLLEFPWKDTIHRLQHLFPLLKRVKFTIGHYRPTHSKELPTHLEVVKSNTHQLLDASIEIIFKADAETKFREGFRFPWRLCYF